MAGELGGKAAEGRDLVMEAMQAAGLKMNPADYEEAPATVIYEISKMLLMNKFCGRNCM